MTRITWTCTGCGYARNLAHQGMCATCGSVKPAPIVVQPKDTAPTMTGEKK